MIENVRMHIVNIITVRDKINNASFLITKLGKINFAYQKEEVEGKRKIFEAEHPASHGDVMHGCTRPLVHPMRKGHRQRVPSPSLSVRDAERPIYLLSLRRHTGQSDGFSPSHTMANTFQSILRRDWQVLGPPVYVQYSLWTSLGRIIPGTPAFSLRHPK